MKFVIVSPRQKYGGAIVLHAICKYLEQLGYDASIYYSDANTTKKGLLGKGIYLYRTLLFLWKDLFDDSLESVKGCKRKLLPFFSNDTIVIYPESIYGNPLNAKNVVRYFLYFNPYPGDKLAYNNHDLFICYREKFNDWDLNPTGLRVHCSYFDFELYKRINYGKREGTCYILRKGKNRKDIPKSFDGPVIDNLSEEQKVQVFNQCEKCISYDTQTAYSGIAAMCGCISIVIPEPGKKRSDYLSEDDIFYGVAYGDSENELRFARDSAEMVRVQYQKEIDEGKIEVEHFAQICGEYFKKK